MPIYYFIPGLESKLTKCLQKYEDIVLQEIYSLIEKEFKIQENKLYEGSPVKTNTWKVGITEEVYKSSIIYKKIIATKLIISKKNDSNNKKEDIICGEVPDGFIIVGWKIKTNSFSKPFNINCKWQKEKEFNIIGSDCFKFNVSMIEKNNESNEEMEVDWKVEIFCIHYNFLVEYKKFSSFYEKKKNDLIHYFINCDCYKFCNNNIMTEECFYNNEKCIKKDKIASKNIISKITFEKCKNEKLFQDLKQVEYFTQRGFLDSFKILNGSNFCEIYLYIKAPDNSPYRSGIFLFNIMNRLDEEKSILLYNALIKTKIYHMNSSTGGQIDNSYFTRSIVKQNLLGALFALYQYFVLNNPNDSFRRDLAQLYKENKSLYLQNCKECTEKNALKEFPNNVDYLFKNEVELNEKYKYNDKIEILCSIGKYIKIKKKEFNIETVFEKLEIKDYDNWSFIVGNNTYYDKSDINSEIINEIKNIGKLIIFQRTRC